MTAINGMKIPAPIAVDSTTSPKTAGTKTSQSRTRAKGKRNHANTPEMNKLMPWIVTHSTRR